MLHTCCTQDFIRTRYLTLLPETNPPPVIHIVKAETDTDSIGHILCKRADELNVDLVALAPHTKSKLQQFFLGSVANYGTTKHHNCCFHTLLSGAPLYKTAGAGALITTPCNTYITLLVAA